MEWKSIEKDISPNITAYQITQNENLMTFKEAIHAMKTSLEFRQFFIALLQDGPFDAFFWEVKPVNESNADDAFEFVLVNGPMLSRLKADEMPFQEYLKEGESVVSFLNLRGDATLIVPGKLSDADNYCHVANFVRDAPADQVEKFWQKVAEEYSNALGEKTKWLSTSGLGVYWLHVRIDTSPKYYRYLPYKDLE